MLLTLMLFGAVAIGNCSTAAAATFPSSPLLDNFATDSSMSPGLTTPALGEGRMTLDPAAHELTGVDHGSWDAALWNTPFAAPVEVWTTIRRAGTNTAALYANITGGGSGTTHPSSGYFAAFDGSQSGGAHDEVSLWRIDSGTERFMTGVASPFADLNAGDQIGHVGQRVRGDHRVVQAFWRILDSCGELARSLVPQRQHRR